MSDPTTKESTNTQQESVFGVDSTVYQLEEREWYQENLDIVFPLLIIAIGIFQFVLRKWILPVSEDIISRLEDQFPSQGLIYQPEFGLFFIIIGSILLVLFNISSLF